MSIMADNRRMAFEQAERRYKERISALETALRGVLTFCDISKPVDADGLTAKVREAWKVLGPEPETEVGHE
jgi:hypothetical protein